MGRLRPAVVAHRGASHDHPEHTLAAYTAALEQGADALECDVRLTADGHLVCLHDRDLQRTTGTPGVVSAQELAALDGVLTLRRLLEAVAGFDRRIELAIETKHPNRYAGLVERRLVELLREFGWHEGGSPVRVMSFSPIALRRLRRLAPGLPVVMLFEHARQWPRLKPLMGGDWIAGPGIETLRRHPAFARRLAGVGREVHVWTVNTELELQTCVDLGVSAVITDRPGYVLGLLGQLS
jgi:glycerophosphoryl diester phosphodiesterase